MRRARQAIDWEGVRERLRNSQHGIDEALVPLPDRVAAIYRERAGRLACRARPAAVAAAVPSLIVRIGEERFAIELGELTEVIGTGACTPVPGSPPQLAGVINLRGEIVLVWDLARLLGASPGRDGGCIVFMRSGGGVAGLRVDRADEIRQLDSRFSMQDPERPPHIKAVTSDLLPLLDVQRLLKEEPT